VTVPLVVALDHDDPEAARDCVARLRGSVDRFKVGSALFTRSGPSLVTELVASGHDVFLDLKFHDTPATVAGAVAAAADLGVWLLTVHATGGPAMLEAAREAAERARGRRPLVVAVTVLTSLDQGAYARVAGIDDHPLGEAVLRLGRLAVEAGLDGVVCAANDAAELRNALGVGPLLVVPGIRPSWSASDHAGQARTGTPAQAIAAGASILVLGRAVTAAPDPREAAERIKSEITTASRL
jgi:orotidine-5'-phosphate decarboxylase